MKFYRCKSCGDMVLPLSNRPMCVSCCNEEMEEIVPNTQDAAVEKHIPILKETESGLEILVGSVMHPSQEEHYIEWVYIELAKGGIYIPFEPLEEPVCKVPYKKEDIKTIYSYCNLHGLWKSEDLF